VLASRKHYDDLLADTPSADVVPIVLYYIDSSKEADLCNEWLFNPYDTATVRQHMARTNETAKQFFRGTLSGEMHLGRRAAFRQGGLRRPRLTLTWCRCPTAAGPQNAIAQAHSKFAGLCKQGGFWPDRIAHVLAGPSAQHYAGLGSAALLTAFQQRQTLKHSYKALLVKVGELHKTVTVMIKNGYDNKASLARSGSSVYGVQLVIKHGACVRECARLLPVANIEHVRTLKLRDTEYCDTASKYMQGLGRINDYLRFFNCQWVSRWCGFEARVPGCKRGPLLGRCAGAVPLVAACA
jgi:hypothetical protein